MRTAIVGMACVFPGAPNLEAYWRNLQTGADAITDAPSGRIDPAFFDPSLPESHRFYCPRGGFVDEYASFDAVGFGVMPVAARGAEPDQLLSLQVAARALDDAGYGDRSFARDRAGVFLGRGGYAGAGRTRLEQHVRGAEQLVSALRSLVPSLDAATLARVRAEFQSQVDAPGADAVIGLVPNLAASRIAHRLDLHGPAFTVDAACASALMAVEHGCRELATGRCDLVLAGGVHICLAEAFWSVFCQMGALSRAQQIRPFDRRADGLVIGEGVGIVVLKRLEDAVRDDDRIYAVLCGAGSASDGRAATLLSPAPEGQILAVGRAWRDADLDPRSVGLIEAHGTATPAGDTAELTTLARIFGPADEKTARAVVGSVKSMIGHAMPAAGAAGLIKAALALHHAQLLPTLHCEEPHPLLAGTRFRTIGRSEPWEAGATPRRAAVNAFGFGGANAHVVLEEHAPSRKERPRSVRPEGGAARLALYSANDAASLADAIAHGRERTDGGAVRAAVFDPTAERLARARAVVARGQAWSGREGIWFSSRGLLASGGTIAFLFPGLDARFEPRTDDVARHFGVAMEPFTPSADMVAMGLRIFAINRLLDRVLRELGVRPSHLAGHSIGEWAAMIAAHIVTNDAADAFVQTIVPGPLEIPDVVFGFAGCGVERVRAALEGLEDVFVTHDNCPHQVLLCGREVPLDAVFARLTREGVICRKLPIQGAFLHSPIFASFVEKHRSKFEQVELGPPLERIWSATTCGTFPDDPAAIREIFVRHLLETVRFRELVDTLYERGVRAFVQVGTGSLVSFVEDTLRGRPHLAIASNVKERSGMDQLAQTLAALFVEGADGLAFDRVTSRAPAPMALALGVPIVRRFDPLPTSVVAARPVPGDALAVAFDETLSVMDQARAEVFSRLSAHRAEVRKPTEVCSTLRLSVDAMPELIDHTFFRQRDGWPVLADRFPVVPMTTIVELAVERAVAAAPGRVAVAVENLRAHRWLAVTTPVDLKVQCIFEDLDRVRVRFDDYAECTVVLADGYLAPPASDTAPLADERPPPIDASALYADHWMFHGPAFQGIVDIARLGSDGIRGTIETGSARGALLDNAGQLFGYWVMASFAIDRLAMPVRIARIAFHAPHPRPGERLVCTTRIRSSDERSIVADMSLAVGDRVWAVLEGWEDRRFETDELLEGVSRWPEKTLLAQVDAAGLALFEDKFRGATTIDRLSRRFLGEAERAELARQPLQRQRAWLGGRIAMKDAVRDLLFRRGHGPIFPAEVTLAERADGPALVSAPGGRDLRVWLVQDGRVAIAAAYEGGLGGLDVRRVDTAAPPSQTPTEGELRFVLGEPAAEGTARLAGAKAAASRAGVAHPVVRDRAGERLLVDDVWVETRRRGDLFVAWTRGPEPDATC